jgi:L-threonylcarbamoyladenylate synthase
LVLKVKPNAPDTKSMEFAARIVRKGSLVAFPTETVYGIAANMHDKKAVAKLCRVKERPADKPFTVHISNLGMVKRLGCALSKDARRLADRYWPGPLTMLLRSKNGGRIGFRMPRNKVALDLISRSKVPVVAPSANISGHPPPTSAREVLKSLNGKIDALIDSGRTKIGVESTVVDLAGAEPRVLREGAIGQQEIFAALKRRSKPKI